MPGTVARISIAPVKALGLVHPDQVRLGPGGVSGDRRFWIVDAAGRLVNNRRVGPLMTIRPHWDEQRRRLELRFPDGQVVCEVVELGPGVDVKLYGEPHPSRRVIGPWEEALSAFAGRELRLLWSESGAVDRSAAGGTVSVVSRASLERLRAQAGSDRPVDGRRFRMLFEVDGLAAHAEDAWIGERIGIGEAEVEVAGGVGRCAITTLDPDRGVRDLDTLAALAGYRPDGSEPLPFGVYGTVRSPGVVRLGDAVWVTGRATPVAPSATRSRS